MTENVWMFRLEFYSAFELGLHNGISTISVIVLLFSDHSTPGTHTQKAF